MLLRIITHHVEQFTKLQQHNEVWCPIQQQAEDEEF